MTRPRPEDTRQHAPDPDHHAHDHAEVEAELASGRSIGRQVVRYTLFKLDPAWRRLPAEEKSRQKAEFAAAIERYQADFMIRTYTLVGTRGDADFLLWQAADTVEQLTALAADLNRTALAGWLTTPHSFLAMTRKSQYVGKGHQHPGQEGVRTRLQPVGKKYFVVYPFVKTRAWYKLGQGARQGMMNEHFVIGHKYPGVRINTTYSYALDDQEFVVGFETDDVGDFLDLVMELRHSDASSYTERDTPSFTCLNVGLGEMLDLLG